MSAIAIEGYQITDSIYDSVNSQIYRAIRKKDKQGVIIKVLRSDYPSASELTRYKQEYEITRKLGREGVIKAYSLEKYDNTLAIAFEDIGAKSLKLIMSETALTLEEFLVLSIKIAKALSQVHAENIIHKDINPSNIILNPATGELKIIDFGIASQLTRENPSLKNPNVLEGTLPYISPEQTGRMNRSLDYRTDFYSLGATFYEMLTLKRPFHTNDPMELVHCHLAKTPLPPQELNTEIPPILGKIVIKLLEKNAESRYQSALGIAADLETCLKGLQQTGTIEEFSLGAKDISGKFQIPQKLYGREKEIEDLLAAFERVAVGEIEGDRAKIEMMLVAGYSGIGKTSIVQEIHKPITEKRGYFISGKFDQFQRNVPYSAVVSAFKELVGQLLSETQEKLDEWREKLLAALGQNGQVIIDVIPEVELIVGKQPAVPQLTPSETQNRFNSLFQNFIGVFCSPEHPLAIFLDDLQWADSATLKLLELITTDEKTEYLFLIGAYRDNEVSPTHPFIMTVEKLLEKGATVNRISLTPLALSWVSQLIADTLQSDIATVQPLAELVWNKTRGNPFFVNEFIKNLHSEQLLIFNLEGRCWQWDVEQIEEKNITDNVVDLTVGKLKKLPEQTQKVLRLAACVGNNFDLGTLAIVYEASAGETFRDLIAAIQEGLILPLSQLEIENVGEIVESELLILRFKFLHDRVQQAANALIEEDNKKALYLQIARLLLANLDAKQRLDRLFEIVDRLNIGRELIAEYEEKIQLISLNLEAGKKAKDATAYREALEYLIVAVAAVSAKTWESHYQLALDAYVERAAVEYLNGNFEESERLINSAIERAKTSIEKAEIYNILIVQYTLRAEYAEAIKIGRKALSLIDVDLPEENLEKARDLEMAEVKKKIGDRSIPSLYDLPIMTSPEKKVAIKLLITMGPPTYRSHQKLWAVITSKAVNLCLEYGSAPQTAYCYTGFGGLLGYVSNDYQRGVEFGELALKLWQEKFDNPSDKSVGYLMIGSSNRHWSKHLKYGSEDYQAAYNVGLESGNLQYAAYAFGHNMYCRFYQGVNLEKLLGEITDYLAFSKGRKNKWAIDLLLGGQMLVWNLIGRTNGWLDFRSEEINNEVEYFEKCNGHKNYQVVCIYNIMKMQVCYLGDRLEEALKCSRMAEELIIYIGTQGLLPWPEHKIYQSLILAALYPEASETEKEAYWQQLLDNQKQIEIWSETCAENFLDAYLLISAEIARLSGEDGQAMELYDRAIAAAKDSDFHQNAAMGNELAAKFYLSRDHQKIARVYLEEACYYYQLWGAKRKVKDLKQKYSKVLKAVPGRSFSLETVSPEGTADTITSNRSSAILDINTLMKANELLAGEIVLEKLLEKLINLAIENAGARNGFLVLPQENNLFVEASCSVEKGCTSLLESICVENNLPVAIVNYVARTKKTVVLNDASKEGKFSDDPYIKEKQPKSVLCSALVNQGKLTGIMYLENNLVAGAFTSDRVETLALLSTQASISIENATLYRTLEEKVADRTRELSDALENLKATQGQLVEAEKMASLGSLVAGVAHEINTPVGNSITAASTLVSGTKSFSDDFNAGKLKKSALKGYLELVGESSHLILSNLERAGELIQSFKEVAVDRSILDRRQFPVIGYIKEILISLKPKLKMTEHTVTIDGDEGIILDSYPGALSQIITNLVVNSIDRAYNGDEAGKLEFEIEVIGDRLILQYSDDGCGIPPENLDKIFEPFFTTARDRGGSGLGLHIVYNLVTQTLFGKITCESAVGEGTKFVLDLPLQLIINN
ncbi:MAG: ATP-binding sensor histidine kinase [Cyanobacteriota bacterium]|nr:ATP-binding sensor histidine kinase [Cyanobacteriota bacterium]